MAHDTLYGICQNKCLVPIYPPLDSGQAGQVWTSDGDGQGSWQTPQIPVETYGGSSDSLLSFDVTFNSATVGAYTSASLTVYDTLVENSDPSYSGLYFDKVGNRIVRCDTVTPTWKNGNSTNVKYFKNGGYTSGTAYTRLLNPIKKALNGKPAVKVTFGNGSGSDCLNIRVDETTILRITNVLITNGVFDFTTYTPAIDLYRTESGDYTISGTKTVHVITGQFSTSGSNLYPVADLIPTTYTKID